MEIDITQLLGDFILAGVVYALLNSHLNYLSTRVKDLEKELKDTRAEADRQVKEVIDRHIADLRDWSGIDPRFNTWVKNEEGATKRRIPDDMRTRLRVAQEEADSEGVGL